MGISDMFCNLLDRVFHLPSDAEIEAAEETAYLEFRDQQAWQEYNVFHQKACIDGRFEDVTFEEYWSNFGYYFHELFKEK